MKRWAVAAMICASCHQLVDTPEYLKRAATDAFSLDIADANRLHFYDVQTFHAVAPHEGQLLCGHVDIRDSQGRLTGVRRFMAYRQERRTFVDPLPGDIPLTGNRGLIAPVGPRLAEAKDSGCAFDRPINEG